MDLNIGDFEARLNRRLGQLASSNGVTGGVSDLALITRQGHDGAIKFPGHKVGKKSHNRKDVKTGL